MITAAQRDGGRRDEPGHAAAAGFDHAPVDQSRSQAPAQNVGKLNEFKGLLDEAHQRYDRLIVLPEERVLFDRFKSAGQKYLQLQSQVMSLSAQGRVEEAAAILNGEMSPLADGIAVNSRSWWN